MIVTINRQYGSGGREIGKLLAERMHLAYYDDEILKTASEESGLCEDLLTAFDERPKSLLYSIATDPYSFSLHQMIHRVPLEDRIYLATHQAIQNVAEKGPCVLIGRCADYALRDREDVVNVFISAPLQNRIARVAARNAIGEKEAESRVKKIDKSRASYYSYYTSRDWNDACGYDICIDSALLGIEGTVELLERLVALCRKRKS